MPVSVGIAIWIGLDDHLSPKRLDLLPFLIPKPIVDPSLQMLSIYTCFEGAWDGQVGMEFQDLPRGGPCVAKRGSSIRCCLQGKEIADLDIPKEHKTLVKAAARKTVLEHLQSSMIMVQPKQTKNNPPRQLQSQ